MVAMEMAAILDFWAYTRTAITREIKMISTQFFLCLYP